MDVGNSNTCQYISNSNHGFCSAVPELAKLNGCCDYSDYPRSGQHLSALDPKRCKIESLNHRQKKKQIIMVPVKIGKSWCQMAKSSWYFCNFCHHESWYFCTNIKSFSPDWSAMTDHWACFTGGLKPDGWLQAVLPKSGGSPGS